MSAAGPMEDVITSLEFSPKTGPINRPALCAVIRCRVRRRPPLSLRVSDERTLSPLPSRVA